MPTKNAVLLKPKVTENEITRPKANEKAAWQRDYRIVEIWLNCERVWARRTFLPIVSFNWIYCYERK